MIANHSNKGHFFIHLAQYKHKKGHVFYIFEAEKSKIELLQKFRPL